MQRVRDLHSPETVWKFSAGDGHRDFSDVFIGHNCIGIGPASGGPWKKGYAYEGEATPNVDAFYQSMKPGDLVLMVVGKAQARAIGVVQSDAFYDEGFWNLDGWNVSHIRRVSWLSTFPANTDKIPGLRPGGYLHKIHDERIREAVLGARVNRLRGDQKIGKLPAPGARLSSELLVRKLARAGATKERATAMVTVLRESRPKIDWYFHNGQSGRRAVTEIETLHTLALPLVEAAGWTYKEIGIEVDKMDAVLYSKPPRSHSNIHSVIEFKRLGRTLRWARDQALGYVKDKTKGDCRLAFLSDGASWHVYRLVDGKWNLDSILDVRCPRESYPIIGAKGAVAALQALLKP